jgi:hypothetical protein
MNEQTNQLKTRTQLFALAIIEFTKKMGNDQASKVLSNQLLRAGTSVGANYRAACRARSKADECSYWLELVEMSKLMDKNVTTPLRKEANELTAIFTSSGKTAKEK